MKIAISGKGGVGKTTITGILARLLSRDGFDVLVIDADPSPNLATVLGISEKERAKIIPLSKRSELISERTGTNPNRPYGSLFTLNPKVDDLEENFAVLGNDNVRLLVLGTITQGGTGCFCPESALLKALVRHLIHKRNQILLMDMDAGVEHLGRGTTKNVNKLIIITEPGMRSVETAQHIKKLAEDLGVKEITSILNKVTNDDEIRQIRSKLNELKLPLIGTIPYARALMTADLKGISPLDMDADVEGVSEVLAAISKIKEYIRKDLEKEV